MSPVGGQSDPPKFTKMTFDLCYVKAQEYPVVVFKGQPVVRRRLGPGKHDKNRGFVEEIVAFNNAALGCVREWGAYVAQHTRPVIERNVCENKVFF